MSTDYVQYGCGWHAPDSWNNFDASPTLRFERIPIIGGLYTKNSQRFPANVFYGDIVRGLPVRDGSCAAIYCSHVLEHLSLNDLRAALSNTYRALNHGGTFRLVLPDLELDIQEYAANPSENACNEFLQNTLLGRTERAKGIRGLLMSIMGNNEHLWMWDYKGLAHELKKIGFKDIRRAVYGDSSDPKFADVEQQERWTNCLGIECRK